MSLKNRILLSYLAFGLVLATAAGLPVAAGSRVAIALVLALCLGLLLGAAWWRRLVVPIERLGEAAQRVGQGDLEARVRVKTGDELEDLARALDVARNQLASRIGEATLERERLEAVLDGMVEGVLVTDRTARVRRTNPALRNIFGLERPVSGRSLGEAHARSMEELSASIAHEIRNPITAAKSLLQQIGEDPEPKENQAYARVALEELGRVERAAYLKLLDGLAWGDSEAQGIRRGADFYHAGLNFAVRFPPGWRVDNKPEHLLAASPDGGALLQMQATDKGTARTPQEYLVVSMKLHDLQDTRAFKINGLPAYSGVTRMQTPFGARDARVAVVFLRQQAFRFFGAARDANAAIERAFLDTVQSLHGLRPDERALARGQRIELTTVRAGDSFAKFARRAPLKNEPEAILRLLNGKYPQGEPAPGELVKLIR